MATGRAELIVDPTGDPKSNSELAAAVAEEVEVEKVEGGGVGGGGVGETEGAGFEAGIDDVTDFLRVCVDCLLPTPPKRAAAIFSFSVSCLGSGGSWEGYISGLLYPISAGGTDEMAGLEGTGGGGTT